MTRKKTSRKLATNGRDDPAVAITGSPTARWLDDLRRQLPGDCPCHALHPPSGAVDGVERLDAGDDGFTSLAAALAAARPGRDWLVVEAGVSLPAHALERLIRAGRSTVELAAMAALTNLDPALTPLPDGHGPVTGRGGETIDRLVYALGRRAWLDAPALPRGCVFWRAEALDWLASAGADGREARALREAGWRLGAADHLYVHHPDHALEGAAFIENPDRRPPAGPLVALRERLAAALEADAAIPDVPGLDGRPVLLHVTHSWGGGVERFVRDLIAADDGHAHLVLSAAGQSDIHSFGQVLRLHAGAPDTPLLREWRLPVPVHSLEERAPGYATVLEEIVADFDVEQVLVSSLIGHSLEALATGLPTVMVLHDYFPVCPALNIFFGEVCAECPGDRLTKCLKSNPHNRLFLDRDADAWLRVRDAFVAGILDNEVSLAVPTDSLREHLTRIEPRLAKASFTRIPHGLEAWEHPARPEAPAAAERLRLVVPGRLKAGKGRELLLDALPALQEIAEIWLVGCGKETADFLGRRGVHMIFDYERERLPELLSMIRPHAGLLLSTVPETWSYTLSELWSLGLPVIATKLGAFAERVRDGGNGLLVAPEAAELEDAVRRLRDEGGLLGRLREGVSATEVADLAAMAKRYRALLPATGRLPCRYRLHAPEPGLLVENALRADLDEARHRIAAQADKLEEHETELLRRASWARRMEKLLDERTAWAQSLREDVERERRRVLERQEHLRQFRERLRAMQADYAALKQEHETMLSSRSWRWTEPLRALTTRLRRVRDAMRFRLGRFRTDAGRTGKSLRERGVADTLRRIREQRPAVASPGELELPGAAARQPEPLYVPSSDEPEASVIVPVYNNSELTFECLASIADHGGAVSLEVIVVDDASGDDTTSMLDGVQGIRVIRNEQNAGFIDSCNRGAAEARGEFLVFLNNDTSVTDGWLEALIGTFREHEGTGLVGARLVYPDGRLQEAGGIVFNDASGWNYGRGDDPTRPEYNFVREVDYCSGACIAVPRALFDRLGRFDERYRPAYYEDTDLAFRVREAGFRVLYQPECLVVHHEGATSGTDLNTGTKRYQVINRRKFRERWSSVLASHPAPGTDIALARQHRLKGRVLIIDALTPQPDQDSGSVRMVNLMRLLQSLNRGVTFFAANLVGIEPYTSRLKQQGVEMLHLPWMHSPTQWFADNGKYFDVVVLSRYYIAKDFVWLVRRHCPEALLVFDTVDLHYLRERRLAKLEDRASLLKAAERTQHEELGVARRCDTTLVVSPVEKEVLADEAPDIDVEVLSNIHRVRGSRRPFAERKDIWFVGGFQHPPNLDAMRWFCGEIWPMIRARLPELEFHIVGSKMPPEIKALEGGGVRVHGFVPDVEPFLDGCRLAVAPLRYGAGVKGKVNQSMSYGQPVVSTSAGMEGMYVTPGEDALVADDAEGFAEAVVRAYRDESLWEKLSANGLANVARHFSFEAARAVLTGLLEENERPSRERRPA